MIDTSHKLHLGYHSNHSDTSIKPLSYAMSSPYLVWRLFGMIGISHILHCYDRTSHILRLGYHSNHSETSITPLAYARSSPYLVWRLFGMIGISHIPHAIVTKLPWQPQ